MNVDTARTFELHSDIIAETDEALCEAGEEGFERFVLWSGVVLGQLAQIRTAHVPEQRSFKTPQGLLVQVEGDALHKLNAWLYENGETLLVQVHAHPTEAYHSVTDNNYPIVSGVGSLSIVAADFGQHGVMGHGTAAYRLTSSGWTRIRRWRLRRLLRVL